MIVSVIIPTYNRPNQIIDTLKSLSKQTLKPNEIIIVNDKSDLEYCVEKYKEILDTDIDLHYIENKNRRGACYSRNIGAIRSKGNILMFLDDDDKWENKKIEKHVDIFKRNSDIGLVYSGRKIVYDDKEENYIKVIKPRYSGRLFPNILTRNVIGPTSSVSLRRHVFFEAGKFDESFPAMQDYDLWIRCCKITKVMHDGSANLIYTVSKSNKQISGNGENHLKAIQLFLKKYKSDLSALSFFRRRKAYSFRYRSVAVSLRRSNYLKSLKWSIKATLNFPRIKDVKLYIPPVIENILKSIFN